MASKLQAPPGGPSMAAGETARLPRSCENPFGVWRCEDTCHKDEFIGSKHGGQAFHSCGRHSQKPAVLSLTGNFRPAGDRHKKFEETASAGRLECKDRGLKPRFPREEDSWFSSCAANNNTANIVGEGHFYKDFARYLSKVWMQTSLAEKYYEKALEMEPSDLQHLVEYAEFVWTELGNVEKATEIFEEAVRQYPEDVELLGRYASFLWETDR